MGLHCINTLYYTQINEKVRCQIFDLHKLIFEVLNIRENHMLLFECYF